MGLTSWAEQLFRDVMIGIAHFLTNQVSLPARLIVEMAHVFVPGIDPLFRKPLAYSPVWDGLGASSLILPYTVGNWVNFSLPSGGMPFGGTFDLTTGGGLTYQLTQWTV